MSAEQGRASGDSGKNSSDRFIFVWAERLGTTAGSAQHDRLAVLVFG